MFDFFKQDSPLSKCYVTYGILGHLDPKQPPRKRKPFSTLLDIPFVHKIDLLLPQELFDMIESDILIKFSTFKYSRVILPLSALLEGGFFNDYIKTGNIIMLSEGKYGIDNVYSLRDGILTLSLDKESYERAGLVGKPDGVEGARGTRARWVVEVNLRLPSMLHGKKGFDRIVYGCKNALSSPVTWLFANLDEKVPDNDHLSKYFPTKMTINPIYTRNITTIKPNLRSLITSRTPNEEFYSTSTGLYEWLSLLILESPRPNPTDHVDSFISRYRPPSPIVMPPGSSDQDIQKLVKVTWCGFLSSSAAHDILVNAMVGLPRTAWCALAVGGFRDSLRRSGDCMIYKVGGEDNDFLDWAVEG